MTVNKFWFVVFDAICFILSVYFFIVSIFAIHLSKYLLYLENRY